MHVKSSAADDLVSNASDVTEECSAVDDVSETIVANELSSVDNVHPVKPHYDALEILDDDKSNDLKLLADEVPEIADVVESSENTEVDDVVSNCDEQLAVADDEAKLIDDAIIELDHVIEQAECDASLRKNEVDDLMAAVRPNAMRYGDIIVYDVGEDGDIVEESSCVNHPQEEVRLYYRVIIIYK